MENTLQEIEAKFRGLAIYESLIMAAVGLAVLLFGYKIKKLAFFIIWFLLGYNLTIFLLPTITSISPEAVSSELYQTLIPIAGGLLLGLMGFTIEKLCVSGICFFLVMTIVVQYFGTDIPTLAVGAIIGVVAGAFATTMMKPAIIIATAVAGGYALTIALLNIFPDINKEIFYWPMLGIISALGAFFQFSNAKHSS